MNQADYEEYIKKLNDISDRRALFEKKAAVGLTSAELAEGYLGFAKEYEAIDAKANYHDCMSRYYHYSNTPEPTQTNESEMLESVFTGEEFDPAEPNDTEYDFDWQKYTE